jgi:hypothetical protein
MEGKTGDRGRETGEEWKNGRLEGRGVGTLRFSQGKQLERGFHVVKAETLERLASGGWMFGLCVNYLDSQKSGERPLDSFLEIL